MIPESYRYFETSTLMDLVTYGDPVDEEPRTEEWVRREEEATRREGVSWRRRGSWWSLTRKKWKWSRLGRRLIARARLP